MDTNIDGFYLPRPIRRGITFFYRRLLLLSTTLSQLKLIDNFLQLKNTEFFPVLSVFILAFFLQRVKAERGLLNIFFCVNNGKELPLLSIAKLKNEQLKV